jgi:hypothetical protein
MQSAVGAAGGVFVHALCRREEQVIPEHGSYPSTSFYDELAWATVWLHRATGNASYLTTAQSLWANRLSPQGRPWAFDWYVRCCTPAPTTTTTTYRPPATPTASPSVLCAACKRLLAWLYDRTMGARNDKTAAVAFLLYNSTGSATYSQALMTYLTAWLPGGGVPYTPLGLAFRSAWGSLSYALNTAWCVDTLGHCGVGVRVGRPTVSCCCCGCAALPSTA